jgi:flagellar motor switch/type III secretory pathway protein FliN
MDNSEVLQRFAELPFPIEVEVGNLSLTVGEIFELREGMVLATDHAAGAPFTLRCGGAELASVEVVVVGNSLSVRVQNMMLLKANGTN